MSIVDDTMPSEVLVDILKVFLAGKEKHGVIGGMSSDVIRDVESDRVYTDWPSILALRPVFVNIFKSSSEEVFNNLGVALEKVFEVCR